MRRITRAMLVAPLAALLLAAAGGAAPAAQASPLAAPDAQFYWDSGWGYGDWSAYPTYAYGQWPWWRLSSTFTSPYAGSPGYPYTPYGAGYSYGYSSTYVPGSYPPMYGPNYGYGPTTGTAGGQQYFQFPGAGCTWSWGAA
jgi:hypothetical protein